MSGATCSGCSSSTEPACSETDVIAGEIHASSGDR
jgi:hypothetical protein